jgi:hypothetical protein
VLVAPVAGLYTNNEFAPATDEPKYSSPLTGSKTPASSSRDDHAVQIVVDSVVRHPVVLEARIRADLLEHELAIGFDRLLELGR